jgi:hypothetical protein
MFADPTINDYLDNVRWHLDKVLANATHAVNKVRAEHAQRGILSSSMTVMRVFSEVKREFDFGVEAALGELRRAASKTKLDPRELRQATAQCLANFAIAMKSIAAPGQLRGLVGNAADEWDKDLNFKLRQFDVGFFVPDEPEVPTVSNAINVNSMINSAILQGSAGATQRHDVTISVDEAKAAIEAIEAHSGKLGLPADKLSDLQSDIATIRSQLAKATPSHLIVGEAARSIRNVAEGAIGGMLTPTMTTALVALGKATGAY